ncbi:hypothetical protein POM88_010074 [Heracleum sosnowskyi]|uniref:MULE transposase domain-containing protein n=1 Tax=Heracleum sosnowskyi TaxID=360622 RepID=A0AAD8JCQ2_9APIA|nr:hypothetical protein POM88_010074 [Heracleum sosnowskyi]
MATVGKEVGYTPTRKKIRDARKIASLNLYGSWEKSYQELPSFLNVLQNTNNGTCVDWYFKEYDLLFQIDGTHLYGKYGGVLLNVIVVDGFHHLLPVAFAIIEGETVASWTWFMEKVRKMVSLQ